MELKFTRFIREREQGLAVTWNNPDIQLYENGVAVSSSSLKPNADYVIDATIYNNSTEAPAVGLPVVNRSPSRNSASSARGKVR